MSYYDEERFASLAARIDTLEQRVAWLETTLEGMLGDRTVLSEPGLSGRAADPSQDAAIDEVRSLARSGKLIQGIKRYRELTGLGLAASKAAVERLRDE